MERRDSHYDQHKQHDHEHDDRDRYRDIDIEEGLVDPHDIQVPQDINRTGKSWSASQMATLFAM